MSKILLTSCEGIFDSRKGAVRQDVAQALLATHQQGNHVCLITSRPKPAWLVPPLDFIHYIATNGTDRQNGEIITQLVKLNTNNGIDVHNFLMLAAKKEDAFLSFNAKIPMLRTSWSLIDPDRLQQYGVEVAKPSDLPKIVGLLNDEAPWYFKTIDSRYSVYALTNAGTMGVTDMEWVNLVNELRSCLKHEKPKFQTAFKLHLLSSVCATEDLRGADLLSYYPSSSSDNNGSDVMASFVEIARTTLKCRFASKKYPLFIRHTPSVKRHSGGVDRIDPTSQLNTIHLNPYYKGKLEGKHVLVFDDYLTYGCSFGVATALLMAAGARSVSCIAMGKFGNTGLRYDIVFQGDPFKALSGPFQYTTSPLAGLITPSSKLEFSKKFSTLF